VKNNQDGKHQTKESGQALVESALVMGLLLLLFILGLEGYRLIRQRQTLDQVARAGARVAAEYGGDTAEVQALIQKQLQLLNVDAAMVAVEVTAYHFDGATITPVTPKRSHCVYGDFIAVQLRQPWRVELPVLGLFVQAISQNGEFTAVYLDKCWRGGDEDGG
jgi:hypothetical protein